MAFNTLVTSASTSMNTCRIDRIASRRRECWFGTTEFTEAYYVELETSAPAVDGHRWIVTDRIASLLTPV
jgi:hypothetical protein